MCRHRSDAHLTGRTLRHDGRRPGGGVVQWDHRSEEDAVEPSRPLIERRLDAAPLPAARCSGSAQPSPSAAWWHPCSRRARQGRAVPRRALRPVPAAPSPAGSAALSGPITILVGGGNPTAEPALKQVFDDFRAQHPGIEWDIRSLPGGGPEWDRLARAVDHIRRARRARGDQRPAGPRVGPRRAPRPTWR